MYSVYSILNKINILPIKFTIIRLKTFYYLFSLFINFLLDFIDRYYFAIYLFVSVLH